MARLHHVPFRGILRLRHEIRRKCMPLRDYASVELTVMCAKPLIPTANRTITSVNLPFSTSPQ